MCLCALQYSTVSVSSHQANMVRKYTAQKSLCDIKKTKSAFEMFVIWYFAGATDYPKHKLVEKTRIRRRDCMRSFLSFHGGISSPFFECFRKDAEQEAEACKKARRANHAKMQSGSHSPSMADGAGATGSDVQSPPDALVGKPEGQVLLVTWRSPHGGQCNLLSPAQRATAQRSALQLLLLTCDRTASVPHCIVHRTVQRSTVQHCTIQRTWGTAQYSTAQYNTVLYSTVLCCAVLYCAGLYCAALCCPVPYNVAQPCAAQYSTGAVQHSTTQHNTAQHSTVQYITVLHCKPAHCSKTNCQRSADVRTTVLRSVLPFRSSHRTNHKRRAPRHTPKHNALPVKR